MFFIIHLLNVFSVFLGVRAKMLHSATHLCVMPALYCLCYFFFFQQPPTDLLLTRLEAELLLAGAAGGMETYSKKYTAYKILTIAGGELSCMSLKGVIDCLVPESFLMVVWLFLCLAFCTFAALSSSPFDVGSGINFRIVLVGSRWIATDSQQSLFV